MTRPPPSDGQPGNVVRFPALGAHRIVTSPGGNYAAILPVHDAETDERLTWNAYVAAVDAHDHHRTASTRRSRTTALLAWRHVFLIDEHGEARP